MPYDGESASADWQMLDPHQIAVDQISSLISTLITVLIGLVLALAAIVSLAARGASLWLILIIAGAVLALAAALFALAVHWPRLKFRNTTWRLAESGLEIRRGVLWKHQISVPLARVQHADVSQGPLQRRFDLGTLTVHTAGTQNASVALEGLNHAAAIQMRDALIRQRKASDVV